MRVYYPNPPNEQVSADLQSQLGDRFCVLTGDKPSDYDVLIEGRADDTFLTPSLKALIVPFAGVPANTLKLLKDNPHISGHNLHHNAADTAEVALALLFAAA